MSEHVLIDRDGGIMRIRMQRPDKKNALTTAMYGAMAEALQSAASDASVRVVLFSGVEGAYTAGNDLEDFLRNPPRSEDSPVNRFIDGLIRTDIPIVAAVDGIAVGIGTTMLLHCEQVFASERSRFSLPFVNLGLVPEAASSQLLAANCGYQKAAQLLMLGEPFDAAEALDCGIVSHVCSVDELMDAANRTARKFAAKPRSALRASKRLMRRPPEALERRARAEAELFLRQLESDAAREALSAFLEKREPDRSKLD